MRYLHRVLKEVAWEVPIHRLPWILRSGGRKRKTVLFLDYLGIEFDRLWSSGVPDYRG